LLLIVWPVAQIGSGILEQAIMLKRELQQSFAQAKIQLFDRSPTLFPPGCVTYDRYIWAYSISNALKHRKHPLEMILN
jgi:hypothetical protein